MVTFLDRRVHPVIAVMVLATAILSLVVAIDLRNDGLLWRELALVPSRVWVGEIWRLATWWLIEVSPIALVFTCVTIFWFGSDLRTRWGGVRFLRYVVTIIAVSSVGTVLAAHVFSDAWGIPHLGGAALGDALTIAWALQFPDERIRIYGMLEVGGKNLAYGTLGLNVLFAVSYGLHWMLPDLIASLAALAIMNDVGGRARRWITRAVRPGHLHPVPGDRHGGPYGPD